MPSNQMYCRREKVDWGALENDSYALAESCDKYSKDRVNLKVINSNRVIILHFYNWIWSTSRLSNIFSSKPEIPLFFLQICALSSYIKFTLLNDAIDINYTNFRQSYIGTRLPILSADIQEALVHCLRFVFYDL